MRYWAVSPNISQRGGRALARWKEIVLEHQAVFMGFSPDPKEDGAKGLGVKFAREVAQRDIILSAHRHNWHWKLVACGKVESTASGDLKLPRGFHYGSYRRLKPFVPLRPDPNLAGLSLKGTSPDKLQQVVAIVELKPNMNPADRELCDRLRAIVNRGDSAPMEATLGPDDEDALDSLPKKTYEEGRQRFARHRRLEGGRNPQLVRDAKMYFKRTHGGKLTCEVCDTNLEKEYGERGRDFIEAHHRVPIGKIGRKTNRRIRDLAMVCANCHRMLHRYPWWSVEKLRRAWDKLHAGQHIAQQDR